MVSFLATPPRMGMPESLSITAVTVRTTGPCLSSFVGLRGKSLNLAISAFSISVGVRLSLPRPRLASISFACFSLASRFSTQLRSAA